jgi:hypothetical protein
MHSMNTLIVLSILAIFSASFMKVESEKPKDATPKYQAPLFAFPLNVNNAIGLSLGSNIPVANQYASNFIFDINSQMSWVYQIGCNPCSSISTSSNEFDAIKSTTYFSPATTVTGSGMGRDYETASGNEGADVFNVMQAKATTVVATKEVSMVLANKGTPLNQGGQISNAYDGVLGFSYKSTAFTAWPAATGSATPPTATASGTSSLFDALIATAPTGTATSPVFTLSVVNPVASTNNNRWSAEVGGVAGYDATKPEFNCTVNTTRNNWECNLGAAVGTNAPSNTTALESDPNAISFFTNFTNANGNAMLKFDTLHNFMVVPISTFNWFNQTFNFSGQGCTNGTLLANADFVTVVCEDGHSSLKSNNKSLYMVGESRVGIEITPAKLINVLSAPTTGVQFSIVFSKTSNDWTMGTDFMNGFKMIFDATPNNQSVTITGGNVFAFTGTGAAGSSKTVYIIVGIAVAVAAIAIAIVIYCCCCKKTEGDDYREQK